MEAPSLSRKSLVFQRGLLILMVGNFFAEAYYLSNTAARWLSLRLQFNGTILAGHNLSKCSKSAALEQNGAPNFLRGFHR